MGETTGAEPAGWPAVEDDLRTWRAAHPDATLTDIEAAVDARFQAIRATVLAELAADGDLTVERCARCGGPLTARGTRTRSVITQGDHLIPLTRAYVACPACGDGLFPP